MRYVSTFSGIEAASVAWSRLGRVPAAFSETDPFSCAVPRERLQGFPDDWTRVPYRGRGAEECPDGPRYRAVGNSMAVPVMRWIGVGIDAAEGKEAGYAG